MFHGAMSLSEIKNYRGGVIFMSRLNVKRVHRILFALLNEINNTWLEKEKLHENKVVCMFSSLQMDNAIDIRKYSDLKLAAIESLIHDIAAEVFKKSEGNAEKAESYILEVIGTINNSKVRRISEIMSYEAELIVKNIIKYSYDNDKACNPTAELLKDFDSVYKYLYGIKSEGAYLERCKKVLENVRKEEVV